MLDTITPLLLTYNEAPNIDRTLQCLTWANRIVVMDSYSTDQTLDILAAYPQVHCLQRTFDNHTNQWNYGVDQVATEWVLSLDADYSVTEALLHEMSTLQPETVDGYFIRFKYCIFGKPLRGNILPPRQALFRKANARYIEDGHTQLLQLNGLSATLKSFLHHDDRKSLSRWLWAQDRYMIIESKKLSDAHWHDLAWGDRIRQQKLLAPFIILAYCLILKGGILDGWHGWYYAFQRTLAELVLSLQLIEHHHLK